VRKAERGFKCFYGGKEAWRVWDEGTNKLLDNVLYLRVSKGHLGGGVLSFGKRGIRGVLERGGGTFSYGLFCERELEKVYTNLRVKKARGKKKEMKGGGSSAVKPTVFESKRLKGKKNFVKKGLVGRIKELGRH